MTGMQTPPKANRVFSYEYNSAARGPTLWGFLVLVPFLMILGAWAAFAGINAAAIAHGEVVLNQDRKTVQHFEGGIVEDILVEEGQAVKRGDPILIIKDVAQRTRINMLYGQLASARAHQARLSAIRDGADQPDFSALTQNIDLPAHELDQLRRTQTNMFKTGRASLETKVRLIEGTKISSKKEIDGLSHQLKAVKRQLELISEEEEMLEGLYAQNLVMGNRLMELQRNSAVLEGEAGALVANIARLEQAILAADIEIIDLKTDSRNAVLDSLQETELTMRELSHQLDETLDQLERTIIKAPATGLVMDLQIHTKGAVLQPADRILDIVPNDDRLIIEARLNPNDIDLVTKGTRAKVILSAYKAKKVPKLDAEVLSVSADILTDQTTGERYFLARLLVDDSLLVDLKANVALYPGMPAQIFFLAGERTVADYLLSPIIDATYQAFGEE